MQKLLTLLLFVSFVTLSFSQEPNKKLHELSIYPTIMVMDQGSNTGGSGFITRSTKYGNKYRNAIITANHIVSGNGPYYAKIFKYKNWSEIESEKILPMYVYAYKEQDDMAIGVFETDEKMPTVTIDFDHKLFIGSKVFHVGCGMMDDIRVDFGEITQPKTKIPKTFKDTIRTNAYSIVGDSGGPLFDSNSYKVIGLCKAVRSLKDQLLSHQSYYTDIKMLKIWNEEMDNSLASTYIEKEPFPVLPFVKMDLQKYKYKLPD